MANVAVIGAGALGLAAARRLAQGGARVTVFEREPRCWLLDVYRTIQ